MGQSVEAQRAIIEGADFMYPSKTFEVRAMLIIPPQVILLQAYDSLTFLSLQGGWHPKNGYSAIPIVVNDAKPFALKLEGNIRPRTIILKDGRVFRKYLPHGWMPYDPDKLQEEEYEKRVLVPGVPFDFEAIWEKVG